MRKVTEGFALVLCITPPLAALLVVFASILGVISNGQYFVSEFDLPFVLMNAIYGAGATIGVSLILLKRSVGIWLYGGVTPVTFWAVFISMMDTGRISGLEQALAFLLCIPFGLGWLAAYYLSRSQIAGSKNH